MHNIKWGEVIILPLMVVVIVVFLYMERSGEIEQPTQHRLPTSMPDFASYTDVKFKKQDFFGFMLPMVRNANAAIQAERNFLLEMSEKTGSGHEMSQRQLETTQSLTEKYRVDAVPEQTLQRLLIHVDIVPESLVLAQAANESAWGTSRFARTGNNFFGIWCFEVGCGEVPKARDAGKTHEVATFRSVQAGVEYYLLTINRHQAYQKLRDLRLDLRRQSKALNGASLAEGLIKYSERGLPYVREIQAMISVNQLDQLSEQR